MKRFLAVFLMLAILLTGLTVTANAATTGWKKEGEVWTYIKADGTLATNEWIKDAGKWYYFIGTAMAQNQIFNDGKNWYAADKTGAMIANGWFGDPWEGTRWDGTKFTGTTWYYAGADGALVRGWKKIDKIWYYFCEDKETDPYMYSDGYYKINGSFYAFKHSGEMIVGWGQPWIANPWNTSIDTDWVYANADGSLAQGWKKIDGKWYFFPPDWPYMVRNSIEWIKDGKYDWESENPTVYGFDKSGAMVENGWFRPSYQYDDGTVEYGNWFYFGKDGAAKKGWFQDKGTWYYLDPTYAYMWQWGFATMSDGNTYYLDKKTGAMKTGWLQEDGNWYYFNNNGAMVRKDWVKSGAKWYWLQEDGVMFKDGTLTIDGKEYKFDKDGAWIP